MLHTLVGWITCISLAVLSVVVANQVYDTSGEMWLFILPVNFMIGWIIKDIEMTAEERY